MSWLVHFYSFKCNNKFLFTNYVFWIKANPISAIVSFRFFFLFKKALTLHIPNPAYIFYERNSNFAFICNTSDSIINKFWATFSLNNFWYRQRNVIICVSDNVMKIQQNIFALASNIEWFCVWKLAYVKLLIEMEAGLCDWLQKVIKNIS